MLNISWAVKIDASIGYLTGTLIKTGRTSYLCKYNPSLSSDDITEEQKWFHHLIKARSGVLLIQASNVPLPPLRSGPSYKSKMITVSFPTERVTLSSTTIPTTDKNYGATIARSFGFKRLPQTPIVPVPVLVVYPAENSAFQQAVVALAEFLQWHGGCSVAIDMWQQGKMQSWGRCGGWQNRPRLQSEFSLSAHRFINNTFYTATLSSQPSRSHPNHNFPASSIPATAHDLYPLILNMVASFTKHASDLEKFWVVQLAEQQDKKQRNQVLELKACKTFCLMKDLRKLCRSLHTHRRDKKKVSDVVFRPGVFYSDKSTVKLREAVEKFFQRGGTTENVYV
ncbi:hypothetical protein INR49_000565 [Caranx melampygus]|nr:hypothetical protein INR49_000565 [Caranx melampygus]